MIKLAMWSGPRNISTALMRSFENRPDTIVIDEPFYAHYLHKTGLQHKSFKEIISRGNTNWNEIVEYLTGTNPHSKKLWYQKHMVHHNIIENNLSWINAFTNVLLIRDPSEVITSYIKKENHRCWCSFF